MRALEHGGAPYDLDNLSTRCRSCHIETHRRKRSAAELDWLQLLRAISG